MNISRIKTDDLAAMIGDLRAKLKAAPKHYRERRNDERRLCEMVHALMRREKRAGLHRKIETCLSG